MAASPESLSIVLNVSQALSATAFASARNVALALAQRRLLTGQLTANGDKVSLFALGSDRTRNDLHDGGEAFAHVEVVSPACRLGIDVLHRIRGVRQAEGKQKAMYSDGLDVAADHIEIRGKGTRKRIILITDGKGRIQSDRRSSAKDLISFADKCLMVGIQFQVIFVDGLERADWDAVRKDLRKEEDEASDGDVEDEDYVEDDRVDESDVEDDDDERFSDMDLSDEEEEDGKTLTAAQARVRRLFSSWRLNESFSRRKKAHQHACESRGLVMPQDATLHRRTLLARLSRVLGTEPWGMVKAEQFLATPTFKPKKATTKYHGLLDIAGVVQIPIKIFSRVRVATRPSGTKLSWATTVAKGKPVKVEIERVYRLREDLKNGEDVDEDDVGDGFPYGCGLYQLEDEEMTGYAMKLATEKCLSVIAFMPRKKMPWSLFLDSVDVVLPMSGPEKCGPQRSVRELAKGLHAKDCAILARFVRTFNAKPELVFLWPNEYRCSREKDDTASWEAVEDNDEDDAEERLYKTVYYFNMVKVPTLQDMRQYPFASLDPRKRDITEDEQSMMDRFVATRDLDQDLHEDDPSVSGGLSFAESDVVVSQRIDVPVVRAGEDDYFDPTAYCNPALDRFFTTLVQRTLEGGTGTSGLPEPAPWAKRLIEPANVLRPRNAKEAKRAAARLKNMFPLTKSEARTQRRHRGQQHIEAATGVARDTTHLKAVEIEKEASYEPHTVVQKDEEEGPTEDDDVGIPGALNFGEGPSTGPSGIIMCSEDPEVDSGGDDDTMSMVSECPLMVTNSTPVADMKMMIYRGLAVEAFEGMNIVVLGNIREGDLVKAAACFGALRRACVKNRSMNHFNSLLERIVSRMNRKDSQGNAARSFVRHMKRDPKRMKVLAAIMPKNSISNGKSFSIDLEPSFDCLEAVKSAIESLSVEPSGEGSVVTSVKW